MQALLVLGGAQDDLGQFEAAEESLRNAIPRAEQLHDAEYAGVGRQYLATVMEETGRWPDALRLRTEALGIFANMKRAYRIAHTLVARGRLSAQAGQFSEAATDLEQARATVEKMEGKQPQLHARLSLAASEIAYYRNQWRDALRFARQAGEWNAGIEDNAEAERLVALATIRTGSIDEGAAACQHAIQQAEEKSRPYQAARGKLLLAQALWDVERRDAAGALARSGLAFFEPRHNVEAVWRCRKLTGDGAQATLALDELKQLWSEDVVRSYLARPDLKNLVTA